MWQGLIHVKTTGAPSFCTGPISGDNALDESSVRFSECANEPSTSRRLEITACNADGIECEVTRLLFEEGLALFNADTISDGDFVFLSLKVSAPEHFTPEMWCSIRKKLLRMVRLSGAVGLGQPCGTSQMYKVVVEAPVEAEGSMRLVWQTLHDRGLQVVQSAMHTEGDQLTAGHPVLSFAASCDICASHAEDASPQHHCVDGAHGSRQGSEALLPTHSAADTCPTAVQSCGVSTSSSHSDRCHLHFSVCDLLHLLPSTTPERTLESLVREGCSSAGLQPSHVAVSIVTDAHTQTPNPLVGAAFSPPTPHLCWQMPAAGPWGASKCPLSHFAWHQDGRRKFVSHALPASITKGTEIFVDDTMGGSTCTCIEIQCVDRKCLVLDILWAVHSLGVRLVQSRINHPGSDDAGCQKGKICVQLFLRDRTSGAFMEEARLRFVLEQLHRAITLPVSVTVVPGVSNSLEVLVFGLLGPGSRGRPCVTKDVTEVLQQESLKMLAAFVGILDDQAVQESLPGEALHEMAENLMFPLLQRNNAVTALPSWDDVEGDEGLVMNTARESCCTFSPRDQSASEGRGLRCITVPKLETPGGLSQQNEEFCQSSSCDASSLGTSPGQRDIPILRDLEQHAYCPFLEDDVPLTRTQTPKSLSFMKQTSLPRGLLSTGLQEGKSGAAFKSLFVPNRHDSASKKRLPVESMLSFFGEESIPHSHVTTGCRHLVELHHFVVQTAEGTAHSTAAVAAHLKQLLEQNLCTVSCQETSA